MVEVRDVSVDWLSADWLYTVLFIYTENNVDDTFRCVGTHGDQRRRREAQLMGGSD